MKIRIYLLALMLTFASITITSQAATTMTKEQTEMRVTEIRQRVDQIRAMDLAHLNRVERISLKHELKGMNKELRTFDPVLYVSVGAIIFIVIMVLVII